MLRRDQEAVAKLERALAPNPNDAEVEHWFGFILVYLGRHHEAVNHIRTAIRLNPFQYQYYNGLGMGFYLE